MNLLQALAPEFTLIACGWVLARIPNWDARLWEPLERITYWVLFPALLFYASARTPLDFATAWPLATTAIAILVIGMLLTGAGARLARQPAAVAGSMFQCGFRFNTYILLALVGRLYGNDGLAALSIVIAVGVPLANAAAVWGLARARGAGTMLRELAINPLIISSLAGLAYSAAGWPVPELAATIFDRFGHASLVLGLLTVGAALRFSAARRGASLVVYTLAVKLALLPALAWLIIRALDLPDPAGAILLLFAAMPLPASAYVITARLGGTADIVALTVTVSVIVSVVTLPFWLALPR